MKPPFQYKNITLYNADCSEIEIPPEASIVSDPPYGCRNDCDYTRFSGGLSPSRNFHGREWEAREWKGIIGDDKPFDPSRWIAFKKCVLFGYQFFADKLPQGSVLVWIKKRDNQLGSFLSDAELIWMKGGKGVYCFRHIWHGFDRESERGKKTLHPSQKPVALMEWCIQRAKITGIVCDPYTGSGATALACIKLGLPFLGCEIDPAYFSIAVERICSQLETQAG